MTERKLIANIWRTPTGEILQSKHRHDMQVDSAGNYIDIWVYEHSKHEYYSRNPALPPVSFQPEVQFQREGKMTLNMTFIMNQDSTIAEIEQEVECLWLFLEKPYCSKWED